MADGGRILLTGATGNVGPHLLAGLLQGDSDGDQVACLVRAGDDESGRARVLSALESAGYDARALGQRVAAVAGDLSLPRFGLAPEAWAALVGTTRHVVHCGAWLGQRERFSAKALTNIAGTTAVVDLCTRAGASLDHVSSIGVLAWTPAAPDGTLPETASVAPPEPPRDDAGQYAYHFSKWMAEQIAAYAAGGVPVTVHRLGDVFAEAADAPLSAVANVIATLKALPDDDRLSWAQHSISDAFAGRALGAIARRPATGLRVLHGVSYVEGVSVADLRRAFAERGVALRTLPLDAWLEALRRDVPWLSMLGDELADRLAVPRLPAYLYTNRAFAACLDECGLTPPTVAERLAPVVASTVGG